MRPTVTDRLRRLARATLVAGAAVCAPAAARGDAAAEPGERGGAGLALLASKALTCAADGPQVVHDAVLLVADGRIEALGPRGEVEVPDGYATEDLGDLWLSPGHVDLHCHVAGSRRDINDMVLQVNSGLRVAPAARPDAPGLVRPLAAGVTTVLFIPGSGTNIGGAGVLVKLGKTRYEDYVLRDPGSLKIAQGDNPTRWGYRMGRILMAYHVRHQGTRGRAYARAWDAYEAGEGPRPERRLDLDVFRALYANEAQVSTHTQYYRLVLTTITMLADELELPTYIDHGSFDSYLTAPLAMEHDVAAILGPREILVPRPPRYRTDGRIEGTAWGFEEHGHERIGFNTDSPVVPQEELQVQAAMGVRYGFSNDRGQALRGLTIVPAETAGIDDRVGSLEPGKHADVVVTDGDPVDPRTTVARTYVDGERVYDLERDRRRW